MLKKTISLIVLFASLLDVANGTSRVKVYGAVQSSTYFDPGNKEMYLAGNPISETRSFSSDINKLTCTKTAGQEGQQWWFANLNKENEPVIVTSVRILNVRGFSEEARILGGAYIYVVDGDKSDLNSYKWCGTLPYTESGRWYNINCANEDGDGLKGS